MKRVLVLLLTAALVGLLPAAAGADPRWVFYSKDTTRYTSPWFAGAHRIMIPFGCTRAPYYSPDPRCAERRGFHHGIDIAMRCGTGLFSPYRGLVIGHTRRVFVHEGERVRPGTMIARASDDGAPDGCHLHFERRAVGGGLDTARKPRRLLALTPKE